MRFTGAFAAALCAALGFAGCGGESKSPLDETLGVLPANAPVAIAISTDLDSASLRDLDAALQRFGVEGGLDGSLEDAVGNYRGISFDRDIRPLLGNELVVGLPSVPAGVEAEEGETAPEVAAIRVSDGAAARELLTDLGLEEVDEVEGATVYGTAPPEGAPEGAETGGPSVGVDGDLVVATDSQRGLEEALRQREEDDRLTEELFTDRLAGLPEEAILRAAGDAPSALESLGIEETAAALPWVRSLHSYGIVANVDGRTATVDSSISGDEVTQNDLPLDPGPSSPRVLEDEPTVATRDQAQSIEFALAAVRSAVPEAAFDEVTRRLQRHLHASVATVIAQFGEGLVARLGDEVTATRSVVEDPATVAKALEALHGQVPLLARIAGSSETVREALEVARYAIPALPVAEPESFPPGSKVRRVPGNPDLYRLIAPTPNHVPPPPVPGGGGIPQPSFERHELVFGLIDGVFVTAPSLEAARQIREAEPVHIDLPPGALAFRIPVKASDLGVPDIAGLSVTVTTIEGGVEASMTGLRLRAQAGL